MTIDRDAYREESRQTWGEMAAGWEARHDWMVEVSRPVHEWLVAKADPQPGEVFLDIAAGPGDLGFDIAGRIGPAGRVISSDFAPAMVALARRYGEERALPNVEYRVLDAERMDLDDASVDGVVCRFGYMLMADPAAALGESRRVLRDGGRLAFAVWAGPEHNPWVSVPAMTLVQLGHMPPPEPGAPGVFSMSDPARVRDLVTGAGFGEPDHEQISFDMRYSDFDDLWDALVRMAGPVARLVTALPADDVDAARERIRDAVEPFRGDAGAYRMPASAWGVYAR